MPQTGGAINRPPKPKKITPPPPAPPKPPPGRARETAQEKVQAKGRSGSTSVTAGTSRTPRNRSVASKPGGGISAPEASRAEKIRAQKAKAEAKIAQNRRENADKFGIGTGGGDAGNTIRPRRQRPRPGGITREVGDSTDGNRTDRFRPGAERGGPPVTGGNPIVRHDPDLVGSEGSIDEFDGSYGDWGSSNDVTEGGGGGTGSALAGRESVGRVGQVEGQSLEEVVYGVQKKGRKTRARGRGE
jgi:hypothetical protein